MSYMLICVYVILIIAKISMQNQNNNCTKFGRFGRHCLLKCNCKFNDPGYVRHLKTGDCQGRCRDCFSPIYSSPPMCQRINVAYGKPTSQTVPHSSRKYESSLAVDGYPGKKSSACTLTKVANMSRWNVDFGDAKIINWIHLYHNHDKCAGFTSCADRSKGFAIWLSNNTGTTYGKICYKHDGSHLSGITTFRVKCRNPVKARFLTVLLEKSPLSICEINVFECSDHTFGENCDRQCNCLVYDEICDKITGKCLSGCAAGFYGANCLTVCPEMKRIFGPNCANKCHCVNDLPCDVITGICKAGCHHRYYGYSCQKTCPLGMYLNDATKLCSRRCFCLFSDQCHVLTGRCMDKRCYTGFSGTDCKLCNSGLTGPRCLAYGQNCSSGRYGPDCKLSCKPGVFGLGCLTKCNCRDVNNTCDPETGWCKHGCAAGYTAHNCLVKCQPGKFGLDCTHSCHCLDGVSCDPVDGRCPGPCDLRYTGYNCTEACPQLSYGKDCQFECHCRELSEDCRGNRGSCRSGCLRGWGGFDCQFLMSDSNTFIRNSILYLTMFIQFYICIFIMH